MSTPVKLPELGESVTEGTITRWLKQVGDTVEVDEPLLEVSTDKVDTEVPSPVAGKILEIKAEEDETVEVGAELCIVGEEDEETSDSGDSGGDDEDSAGSEEAEEAEDSESSEDESSESSDEESSEESTEDSSDEEDEEEPEPEEKPAAKQGGGGGGGTPVKLPELGESVTEGTITRWLKKVGDEVEVDEPLLEVSTDKVDTEVPSPVAGTLQEIKAEEDETVEVGAELCIIGEGAPSDSGAEDSGADDSEEADETASEDSGDEGAGDEGAGEAEEAAEEPEEEPEPEPSEEESEVQEERAEQEAPAQDEPAEKTEEPAQESAAASGEGGTYVTPLVRKMAAEHGVDLASIKGTGVGGRIRKQDVLAAAEEQKKGGAEPAAASAPEEAPAAAATEPSPLRGRTEPMTRLRKTIAKRMVESLQTSAQLTTVVEVDVTGIARLRESVKEEFAAREGVKLSFMPFFAKATTDALKSHPALNAKIDMDKGEITYFDHENLAIAVDTEKGLLTPVIKEAGDLSVSGLAKKIADVADRTRRNKIGPDDLSGGTFTLTNTGSRGALFDTPIINQPQVAILGTGAVVKRPVVIDDPNLGETIAVRHMCFLALTYDHRLVDGADAARFLSEVKERLESAQFEV